MCLALARYVFKIGIHLVREDTDFFFSMSCIEFDFKKVLGEFNFFLISVVTLSQKSFGAPYSGLIYTMKKNKLKEYDRSSN
jgi:hypothetical protein